MTNFDKEQIEVILKRKMDKKTTKTKFSKYNRRHNVIIKRQHGEDRKIK